MTNNSRCALLDHFLLEHLLGRSNYAYVIGWQTVFFSGFYLRAPKLMPKLLVFVFSIHFWKKVLTSLVLKMLLIDLQFSISIRSDSCKISIRNAYWRNSKFRSSHQRCSIKKVFLKISQIHRKTPVLESLFLTTPFWPFSGRVVKKAPYQFFPCDFYKHTN